MTIAPDTDRARPLVLQRDRACLREVVARRHGRRQNLARMTPRSQLRTPTNQPRDTAQRWGEKVDRSIKGSETPQSLGPPPTAVEATPGWPMRSPAELKRAPRIRRGLSDKHGHLYGSDNGSFPLPCESASGGLSGSSETETGRLKPRSCGNRTSFGDGAGCPTATARSATALGRAVATEPPSADYVVWRWGSAASGGAAPRDMRTRSMRFWRTASAVRENSLVVTRSPGRGRWPSVSSMSPATEL